MSQTLPRTQLVDEQYDKLNKSDCSIAFYLSPERILFSVLDAVHHKVISVNDYPLEKTESGKTWTEAIKLMNSSNLELPSFSRVKIALDYGKSVLIPQELFAESDLKAYLDFGLSQYELPVKDFISTIPAYNIYSIQNELLESLLKMFEKSEMYHISTAFIANIIRENKSLRDNKVFASIQGSNLHVAAIAQGKFVFYNCYAVRTKEDFTYYLMAVTEELSFHPEEAQISLGGAITPDSEYYQTAKKFLKNLTFTERPKVLKYSARLDTVPKHFYSLLYSIHLCG